MVTQPPATPSPWQLQRVRIALLGMYASANLGDVAIQQTTMAALRARRPGIEFVGVCTDPSDAARTFGMNARSISGFGPLHSAAAPMQSASKAWYESAPWPIQRTASRWLIERHMREFDMMIVSGSGQIDDFWGGPWSQPLRLLNWTRAARRLKRQVAYFGVGVDQLHTHDGRRMVKAALSMADSRVLRDSGSLQALQEIGLQARCEVCPDPAFYLLPPWAHGTPTFSEGRFAVISPIARNAWPDSSGLTHDEYVKVLASCADHLLSLGVQVRFVCSQTRMDPPVVALVQSAMKAKASDTVVQTPSGVADYLHAVRGAQVVLASRLHALILSMVAGTPVVAISYARKVRQQMIDVGLERFDLPYEELASRSPRPLIDDVLNQRDAIASHIAQVVALNRDELNRHFDQLASLIP